MKALLVALLVAQVADAPIAVVGQPLAPDPAVLLPAGEALHYDAVCMNEPLAVANAKRVTACEATVAEAEKDFLISKPVLIGGVVGVFLVGITIGAAAVAATKR